MLGAEEVHWKVETFLTSMNSQVLYFKALNNYLIALIWFLLLELYKHLV